MNLLDKCKKTIINDPFLFRMAMMLRRVFVNQFTGWVSFIIHRLSKKPYLGIYLYSRQGSPVRYIYIAKVIKLLSDLSKVRKPINMLEVGVWAGGSTIALGEALQKFNGGEGRILSVDPWEPYFNAKDSSKTSMYSVMAKAMRKNRIFNLFLYNIEAAGIKNLVIPIKGKIEAINYFSEDSFDFAFIDGSHYYSDVIHDIRMIMPLIKEGGVISGDDLELQLHESSFNSVKKEADEDYIQDEQTGKYFHPGVTFAVAEVFGEVSCWEGYWAMQKTSNGWRQIYLDS